MEKFDLFLKDPSVTVGDGLPDAYQAALVQYAINNFGLHNHDQLVQQYEENRAFFRADIDALQQSFSGDFIGMKSYDELFVSMLGFSAEMQAAVNAFFTLCTDKTTGLPHAGQYHALGTNTGAKSNASASSTEPFSAAGDPDHDGLTNVQEYTMVVSAGGSPATFAQAAFDPQNMWSSNQKVPALSVSGLFALCAALCLGCLLVMRRQRA